MYEGLRRNAYENNADIERGPRSIFATPSTDAEQTIRQLGRAVIKQVSLPRDLFAERL